MSSLKKLLCISSAAVVTAATILVGSAPAQASPSDPAPVVSTTQASPASSGTALQALQLYLASRGQQYAPGANVHAMSTTKTSSWKAGTWALWTRDTIVFTFTGTSVLSSYAYQECGAFVSNSCTGLGVRRVSSTSASHEYRFHWRVGAVVPTPWGSQNWITSEATHGGRVAGNGGANFWRVS